tara:strand:+ start:1256 stop:1738 length:483 start_codon:yes stop_codon:yes gene_type:complete
MSRLARKEEKMANDTIDLIRGMGRLCNKRTERLADVEHQLSVATTALQHAKRSLLRLEDAISSTKREDAVLVQEERDRWSQIESHLRATMYSLEAGLPTDHEEEARRHMDGLSKLRTPLGAAARELRADNYIGLPFRNPSSCAHGVPYPDDMDVEPAESH